MKTKSIETTHGDFIDYSTVRDDAYDDGYKAGAQGDPMKSPEQIARAVMDYRGIEPTYVGLGNGSGIQLVNLLAAVAREAARETDLETAAWLDAQLIEVSGTLSPASFIDRVADYVSMLRQGAK